MIKSNNFFHSPLHQILIDYLEQIRENKDTLYIFVPFIKTDILKILVDKYRNNVVIVTTWKTNDLLSGSSELKLYLFCKEQNITLYINNKIHLKVFSAGLVNAIICTGNISKNGLMPNGNYECGVFIEKLSIENRLFFEKIRKEARLVTDVIYHQLLEWYEKQTKELSKLNEFDSIVSTPENDNFLISALPMTKDIFELVNGYRKLNLGLDPSPNKETAACIYHDLANFEINLGLSEQEFLLKLKKQFFAHPFIQKINEFISPEAYFGRIKEWIQNNCTDVPVPSRRELTGNVQVLLEWFERLGDGKYIVDVPGSHSQRITKVRL